MQIFVEYDEGESDELYLGIATTKKYEHDDSAFGAHGLISLSDIDQLLVMLPIMREQIAEIDWKEEPPQA